MTGYVTACAQASPPLIPMFTYYQLLPSTGMGGGGGAFEVTQFATNATFMSRYFDDWRFLLQKMGRAVALLHIEPDFWGFAEQTAPPAGAPAAVASANATDCGSQPNTIASMGKCMIAMVREYAPHALVALHASGWSTTWTSSATPTRARCSTSHGPRRRRRRSFSPPAAATRPLRGGRTSDRDAGYYQCVEGKDVWWDATNATLPVFTRTWRG